MSNYKDHARISKAEPEVAHHRHRTLKKIK